MNKVWFTADTHFGHAKIVGYQRPHFVTLEEHDETLIRNWNERVKPGDTVYHLGDFAWHHPARYRARLNGQIHLIKGNHDRLKSSDESLFESISDYKKVKIGGQKIYLLHYAMRVWNGSHHGTFHLYGHSHGSLPDDPNALSMDVGVDVHSLRPVSYDEVTDFMANKTWKPIDHHGRKS